MPEESVGAVVRLRPRLPSSSAPTLNFVCLPNSISLRRTGSSEERSYGFTAVYDSGTDHETLYGDQLSQLVLQPLQGINATVFAYGHTGAGKTHTMLGTKKDPGMIPRSIKSLLSMAAFHSSQGAMVHISMSYLEVYNEKVFDLLVPKSAKQVNLPICQDFEYNISVRGLSEVPLTTFDSFQSAFGPASEKRTTASTKLNAESSRSHAVLILKVKHRDITGRQLTGKLHLIDLAGSENAKRAGNVGDRLKESGAINTSLFALSQVVNALTAGKGNVHIPYRDSKLTRLLQDSLGGSARSVVIANIAPEETHLMDTLSTLQFATKSMQIVNKPTASEKQVSSSGGGQTEASSMPAVAPRMDVLPSPFVRKTKELLSDEMRSIQTAQLQDQSQMQSMIDNLAATVALLVSQQQQQQQMAPTGNVVGHSALADLCRRPLHSAAVFSAAPETRPYTSRSSSSTVASQPSLDQIHGALEFDSSSMDSGSSCNAMNPSNGLEACGGTFVVDRQRSLSVPFSQLEDTTSFASPLLPSVHLPAQCQPAPVPQSNTAVATEGQTSSSSCSTSTSADRGQPQQAVPATSAAASKPRAGAHVSKSPPSQAAPAKAAGKPASKSSSGSAAAGGSQPPGKAVSSSGNKVVGGTSARPSPPLLEPRPPLGAGRSRTSQSPPATANAQTKSEPLVPKQPVAKVGSKPPSRTGVSPPVATADRVPVKRPAAPVHGAVLGTPPLPVVTTTRGPAVDLQPTAPVTAQPAAPGPPAAPVIKKRAALRKRKSVAPEKVQPPNSIITILESPPLPLAAEGTWPAVCRQCPELDMAPGPSAALAKKRAAPRKRKSIAPAAKAKAVSTATSPGDVISAFDSPLPRPGFTEMPHDGLQQAGRTTPEEAALANKQAAVRKRKSILIDPTFVPPSNSDLDFMTPELLPRRPRAVAGARNAAKVVGDKPKAAIGAAKKRRRSVAAGMSSVSSSGVASGSAFLVLETDEPPSPDAAAVSSAISGPQTAAAPVGQPAATAPAPARPSSLSSDPPTPAAVAVSSSAAAGGRRKRRSVAVMPVAGAPAVVWENDVENVQPCIDEMVVLAAAAAATRATTAAADESSGSRVAGTQKKKRLISRKAIRNHVVNESPLVGQRLPLQVSMATNRQPFKAAGSSSSEGKALASAEAARFPSPLSFSSTDPSSTLASLPTVAPVSQPMAVAAPVKVVAVTPMTRVLPMVVPDSLYSTSPEAAVEGWDTPEHTGKGGDGSKCSSAGAVTKDLHWTVEEDQALHEAQALYPTGQRFISVTDDHGQTKKFGRNVLIATYISKKSGRARTAQQVGRRCRIMVQKRERDHGESPQTRDELKARILLLEKIAAETKKVFNDRIGQLVSEYRDVLGDF